MNAGQRLEIRKKIQTEIEACKENLKTLTESAKPISPDNSIGRLTRMGGIVDQGVTNSILAKTKQKLAMLELALKNIENEDFGICKVCGSEIAIARLLAIPECELCIKCANRK